VILPEPEILKVFFALEWVLTFGISIKFNVTPAGAFEQTKNLWDHLGIIQAYFYP
jgi:hypothetical protein